MQYSAVIIPSLCRDKHLKKCLDSLSHCTHANETDVFIGLDYPAKESHFPGYQRICEYLPTVKGFHSLTVLKRSENFGSKRNYLSLLSMVEKTHESFISMDDDCEVAPNFLDYVHKGLEKFQGDSRVIALSGYSYRNDFPCGESNFYLERSGFSVWGIAMTFENRRTMISRMTRWYSLRKILNPFTLCYAAWYSWGSFLFLFMHSIKPDLLTDYVLSNYLLFEGKNMVMPAKSLVRNNGFDGSGEHCQILENVPQIDLPTDLTFDFIGDGLDNYNLIDAELKQGKRKAMPFTKMLRHIYEMAAVRLKRIIH